MPNWATDAPDAKHLRLFLPGEGWRSYADRVGGDGRTEAGSQRLIESAFLNALNATNLVILTGTGSSFAAKNPVGKPEPAGMAALWIAVEAAVGTATFEEVGKRFTSANVDKNIEKLLTLCKLFLELNETSTDATTEQMRKFVADAERCILATVDFVDADTNLDAHALVVQKVGRRGHRKPRAKFFTTNYDLCFEEAARRHRFTIIDGFSHTLVQTYDRGHFDHDIVRREAGKDAPDYIENVFHLYKLHGSIDWRRMPDGEIIRSRNDVGEPILIYPRSSKYQEAFDAPYLDMMGALQAALREPDTALVISGFGFNDDHLSRPILSAIESNLSMRLVICDPAFLSAGALALDEHAVNAPLATTNKFYAAFHRLAASGDARLHLINGRFSDMAHALPDLIGETDRERHAARIRVLRGEEGKAP
ncbi:SIR2 family protein [Caulobacter sp. RHG1]|uniref:SIR2 family protein n=1 Tax=Caulobacter sp. (strain RHG1) TaxID=2545762 RepID=UPI0015553E91|nr:SIR2 family protein [Caulobacter sp. RHG1]NQE65313.1 hypothetical protein [Caulobacter sp. RHG1]